MLRAMGIAVFALVFMLPVSAQSPAHTFVPGDCPFEPTDDVIVECGMVMLPENRAIPDGNQVQIAVAVFRAWGDDPLPDPVFFLDGGPGSYTLVRRGPTFRSRFALYNQRRDVVLMDYRGTGASIPNMFCDEVQAYNMVLLEQRGEANVDGYSEAIDACHQRLTQEEKIDLSMYRSAIIARDVMDIREALGYDEINLLGVSYGTRLALTILRDHPEGIRSVILDGVVPPQVNTSVEGLSNAHRALEELFAACAAAPACDQAFPDLRSRFYTAANQLNDKSATLEMDIPSLDDSYEVHVDGRTFVNNVTSALYSTGIIPSLPIIIDHAAAGNYDLLQNIVSVAFDSGETSSLGLRLAIQCNEEMAFRQIENDGKEAESLSELTDLLRTEGVVLNFDTYDLCDYWGPELIDPIENQPVYSEVSALIFNGQFDPVTPPRWGELAAETLPNSTVVTFAGAGHGVSLSGSECVNDIALTFLDNPSAALDTGCADEATIHWLTVDLSNSLAGIEALLEGDEEWYLEDKRTTLFWNYGTWLHPMDYAMLRVLDSASPVPKTEELEIADYHLSLWDDYELINECVFGDLRLYEFSAQHDTLPQYSVRYWVDRRRPEQPRQVFMAFPKSSSSILDTYSMALYAELPNCGD